MPADRAVATAPPNNSLRRQFRNAIMTSCLCALSAAFVVLLTYDFFTQKNTFRNDHIAIVEAVASSLSAAVIFEDKRALRESLDTFRVSPNIFSAAVINLDGAVVMEYAREKPASYAQTLFRIDTWPMTLTTPIYLGPDRVGELTVAVTVEALVTSMLRHIAVVIIILIATMLALAWLSNRLSRSVVRPIENLESAMSGVADAKEYDTRVAVDGCNELSRLSAAFNAMLEAISERDNRMKGLVEQLVAARDDAKAASKAKSTFLAVMSHEIRTPLNGVLGMAQALAGEDMPKKQRDHVETIIDSGNTLMTVVNDVLDLSKIESGKLEIAPITDNFEECLSKLVKLWRPMADEKDVMLSLDIAPNMPRRMAYDPVRVRQCISNLVSNALKFTHQGFVEIKASVAKANDDHDLIRVEVRDTGIGMSQSTLDNLFTAFVQADDSTTRRFGGTGLGLTITRDLARLMGGDVTASSAVSKGSSFVFTFRADRAEGDGEGLRADAAIDATDAIFAGTRILLVDDNDVNRQVVHAFLAAQQPEITDAVNGLEALKRLDEQEFDLVLLDIQMPIMDGVEALKRIRARPGKDRSVYVIALTADAMEGDHERYLAMGMDGYIPKPIDPKQLISEITKALARNNAEPNQPNAHRDCSD